ncbi:MAG: PAS domain-containing protein [Planctomycetes bacterium]|nr:PAS domain-containing protein [Planctomycetota bacterium]
MHVPAGQELLLPRQPATGARFETCLDPAARSQFAAAFAEAVVGNRPESIEFAMPRPGGERFGELRCVLADDGAVLVVVRDVTSRRALEAQLRHSQKLEAVGLLAGGVAHDFNNLLTVVLGNAEEIGRVADTLQLRGLAAEIADAARRGADLTRQLLAFSRQQALAPEALELGDVVERLAPLLRRLLGRAIVVETASAQPAWVRADRGQIEQVLMNLAVNARDAMPNGGRLRIATGGDAVAGAAELEVADTGVGMSAAVRARAFEPFFTTKEVGRGTGLGLATVYGIVQQSGGTVAIDSVPGAGTTVRIRLPAIVPSAAPAATR